MTDSAARPIRLGLVGIGKIARDQHLPAIAADPRFELVATASRNASVADIPAYADIESMIAGGHALDAVSLCTPPSGRDAIARAAIEAGLHVMLEKPPGATLSEVRAIADDAQKAGVTLFATWHSRAAAGVEPARVWLADRAVGDVRITWKEDIRRWHPGQDWILGAGGFGVFDPGINALSIATHILPVPLVVEHASIVVPAGRQSPIAATLAMRSGATPVLAEFDFLQTGPQSWDIAVETDAGVMLLGMGGAELTLPGQETVRAADREYPNLYACFADLVDRGESDVDLAPLRLVADAFLLAERDEGPAFDW